MAKLYKLNELRTAARRTFFDRNELNLLLSVYSRRVISGEWRDYAIDQAGPAAVFSIFRHSLDTPLFRIAKHVSPGGRQREYIVFSGRERLARTACLSEALKIFDRNLKVVS